MHTQGPDQRRFWAYKHNIQDCGNRTDPLPPESSKKNYADAAAQRQKKVKVHTRESKEVGTPAGEAYILEKESCLSRLAQQEHCGKVLRSFIGNDLMYSCTEQTQKIQA